MQLDSCGTVAGKEVLCIKFCLEGHEAEVSDKTFREIIDPPPQSHCSFYDFKVYKHQLETFNALIEGKNVVLASETGSGKTESWVSYILYKFFRGEKERALVFYPTNALINNQLSRLSTYGGECLYDYFMISGLKHTPFVYSFAGRNTSKLKDLKNLRNALIVLTNPEKISSNLHDSNLLKSLKDVELIVIDEFDFYNNEHANKLLSLIRVLYKDILEREIPKMLIMSATLTNSDVDLKSFNNKDTVFIKGFARRPKNVEKLLLGLRDNFDGLPTDAIEKLDYILDEGIVDDEVLRKVLGGIKSLKEILPHYIKNLVNEDGVSLLFTTSIRESERVYSHLNQEVGNLVCEHHSGISDEFYKKDCLEGLKESRFKLGVSVKTLGLGIDIKTIKRVIHYGLPRDITEFIQREGRKGRSFNDDETETLIIPLSLRDLYPFLGKDPKESFLSWLKLGSTTVVLNPSIQDLFYNGYKELIKLRKLQSVSPQLNRYLKTLRVVRKAGDSWVGTFYSFETPDNVKVKFKDVENTEITNDAYETYYSYMVRYLQEGAIDYNTLSAVYEVKMPDNKNDIRKIIIYEVPLKDIEKVTREDSILRRLYNKYLRVDPSSDHNIVSDVISGKLSYIIITKIILKDVRKQGLVSYEEIPDKIGWRIETENGIKTIWEKYSNKRPKLHGITYAYEINVKNKNLNNIDNLSLAISLINAILRKEFGINLDTIGFYLDEEHSVLTLWERNLCGVLQSFFESKPFIVNKKDISLNKLEDLIKETNYEDPLVKVTLRLSNGWINKTNFNEAKNLALALLDEIRDYSKGMQGTIDQQKILNYNQLSYTDDMTSPISQTQKCSLTAKLQNINNLKPEDFITPTHYYRFLLLKPLILNRDVKNDKEWYIPIKVSQRSDKAKKNKEMLYTVLFCSKDGKIGILKDVPCFSMDKLAECTGLLQYPTPSTNETSSISRNLVGGRLTVRIDPGIKALEDIKNALGVQFKEAILKTILSGELKNVIYTYISSTLKLSEIHNAIKESVCRDDVKATEMAALYSNIIGELPKGVEKISNELQWLTSKIKEYGISIEVKMNEVNSNALRAEELIRYLAQNLDIIDWNNLIQKLVGLSHEENFHQEGYLITFKGIKVNEKQSIILDKQQVKIKDLINDVEEEIIVGHPIAVLSIP